jgi:hypothetical protein
MDSSLLVPKAKEKGSRRLRSRQSRHTFPASQSLSLSDHQRTKTTTSRKRSSRKSISKSTKRSSKRAESSSIDFDLQDDSNHLDRHSCHERIQMVVEAKHKQMPKEKARPKRESKSNTAKLKSNSTAATGKRSSGPSILVSSKDMAGWRKVVSNAIT